MAFGYFLQHQSCQQNKFISKLTVKVPLLASIMDKRTSTKSEINTFLKNVELFQYFSFFLFNYIVLFKIHFKFKYILTPFFSSFQVLLDPYLLPPHPNLSYFSRKQTKPNKPKTSQTKTKPHTKEKQNKTLNYDQVKSHTHTHQINK